VDGKDKSREYVSRYRARRHLSGCVAPQNFNLGFMSRPLYRRYSLNMKQGGPARAGLNAMGKRKVLLPGMEPWILVSQPLTYFIMDYAFPVRNELEWNWKKRSLAYFKIIFCYFPKGNRKTNKVLNYDCRCADLYLNPGNSWIWSWNGIDISMILGRVSLWLRSALYLFNTHA